MYVEEKNRSWCSSSSANDQRAITIECASDTTEPYAFRDIVYQTLIKLCVDICQRNGKNKLQGSAIRTRQPIQLEAVNRLPLRKNHSLKDAYKLLYADYFGIDLLVTYKRNHQHCTYVAGQTWFGSSV